MKDTIVVSTEKLPKREPIVVNRDALYSFLCKEDADPQACWLERKRQERIIKAAKAALNVSNVTTLSSGSLVVDSSKFGNVQQKVINRNQNKTPSPPSSISTEEDVRRVNQRKSSPKANLSDGSSPSSSISTEENVPRVDQRKSSPKANLSDGSSSPSSISTEGDLPRVDQRKSSPKANLSDCSSPPSSISTEEDLPRVDQRKSSPKANLSDGSSSGIKVNRHKGPSPPTSVVSSNEDDVQGKFSPKDDNLTLCCDSPSGIRSSNRKHFAKIGHYLNSVYEKEKLCDISFKLDNMVFPTHKVVLASQSKLFERIFQSKAFTEPSATAKQIQVKGVSVESLHTFIKCIYSGDLHLMKPECLPDILQLSQVFQVEQVTSMCYQLISSLCDEDILHLLPKMRKAGDVKVCDIIIDVIAKRFLDIRNCPSFFNLDFHSLCLVLLSDGLNVNSEMQVFDTAVSWLHHHNVEERLKHLDQLMDTIRFNLLPHKDLMDCFRKCPALKQSPHCVGLITMANWVQTSIDLKQQDPLNLEASKQRNVDIIGPSVEQYLSTHFSPDMKEPDVSFDIIPLTEDSLKDFNLHACLGSQSWSTVSAAHVQQYSESKCHTVSDVNDLSKKERAHKPRILQHAKKKQFRDRSMKQDSHHGQSGREAMVWSGQFWYMVGGARYRESKGVYPTKKVMVYETNKWVSVAPMNVARMKHSLCVADGLLYAIGGVGKGDRILTSVECFNPRTNSWFFIKDLPEPRAGATASAEGGSVRLEGGYAELNGQPSTYSPDEAIVYNVESNKWTRKY